MNAIDLLKSRQAEQSAQAAAKQAMEDMWKQEQVRQLEPIKIAMRQIATAQPAIMVSQGSGFVEFRENEEKCYKHPLTIQQLAVNVRIGYDNRFECVYVKQSQAGTVTGTHFEVRDGAQYGRKPRTFADPIEAINYPVSLIAEFSKK